MKHSIPRYVISSLFSQEHICHTRSDIVWDMVAGNTCQLLFSGYPGQNQQGLHMEATAEKDISVGPVENRVFRSLAILY